MTHSLTMDPNFLGHPSTGLLTTIIPFNALLRPYFLGGGALRFT